MFYSCSALAFYLLPTVVADVFLYLDIPPFNILATLNILDMDLYFMPFIMMFIHGIVPCLIYINKNVEYKDITNYIYGC